MPGQPVILGVKVRLPVGVGPVFRRLLVEAVLSGGHRVTAVIGAAGFGKTTAVALWAAQVDEPLAWLTVDPIDNVPGPFWRYLAAAFEQTPLLSGSTFTATPTGPPGDGESLASDLLRRLGPDPLPGVIVIDDLHHITDALLLEQLRFFIERAPSTLRFVLVARSRPGLPWGRWAARGELGDVGEDLLRMDDDEATELVSRVAPREMSAATKSTIVAVAAGWPAAVRLAAVAVGAGELPERAALELVIGDRQLFDLVATEILASLPQDTRDLVRLLSLLDDLDPRRCELLLGVTDGAGLLDRLAAAGIPMVALDPNVPSYRLHALFRDVLIADLARTRDAELPALHRRTAAVENEVGNPAGAFRHLIDAGDLEGAYQLFWALLSDAYRSGSRRRGAEWVDLLPPNFIGTDASRAAAYSTALLWIRRPVEAGRWHRIACELAGADTTATEDTEMALTPVFHALDVGDTDEVRRLVGQLAARHGPDFSRSDREALLSTAMAIAALVDEAPDARTWVEAIADRPDLPERVRDVAHPTRAAWELFQRGRLDEAQALASTVLDAGAEDGTVPVHAATELFSVLALLHLERLELDDAEHWARRAVDSASMMPPSLHQWLATSSSIAVIEARSGAAAALATLQGWNQPNIPVAVAARIRLSAAEIEARAGSGIVARRWLDGLDETPRVRLVRARIALGRNLPHHVRRELNELGHLPLARRIEADLLRARLGPGSGAMVEALEAGAGAGFLWTYLREDPETVSALRDAVLKNPSARYQPLGLHLLSNSRPSAHNTARALPQSLTAAELAVLRELQLHRPYREVAAELNVSVNTIRTHAHAIRRKLGVSSRLEAVRRAVELGLLD
ncbi:MAG: hypothetical protein EXQ71_11065 [Acidimicrobiia bacterium]|nr:hypothetical protein [Acidimicrobiia bacterium]